MVVNKQHHDGGNEKGECPDTGLENGKNLIPLLPSLKRDPGFNERNFSDLQHIPIVARAAVVSTVRGCVT